MTSEAATILERIARAESMIQELQARIQEIRNFIDMEKQKLLPEVRCLHPGVDVRHTEGETKC